MKDLLSQLKNYFELQLLLCQLDNIFWLVVVAFEKP